MQGRAVTRYSTRIRVSNLLSDSNRKRVVHFEYRVAFCFLQVWTRAMRQVFVGGTWETNSHPTYDRGVWLSMYIGCRLQNYPIYA